MKVLTKNLRNLVTERRGLPWLIGALVGAGLGLYGCQASMNQNVGCNVDSDCPNQLHCDSTGNCVAPPAYVAVTIGKLGDGDGTITSAPAGISCGATCTAMFAVGSPLTLTAAPNNGSAVSGFSVGCNSSTTTCTFTPSEADSPVQVLVNFTVGGIAPPAAICNSSGYCWENPHPQGNRLNKVISVGTNNEWAVGDSGTIVHRTSTATTLEASGVARNLYSLWASGADLYAVGEAGTILHSSGGAWSAETSGVTTDLYDLAGNGANIYAVGAGGIILKRSGTGAWSKETSPTTRDLHGLTSTPAGDLYGVGNSATVIHYTLGTGTWTAATDPVFNTSSLNAIAAAPTGTLLYMTSIYGEIFRLSAGTYTRLYQSNVVDLHGIAVNATGIIAVGLQGTVGTILRSSDGTTWTTDTISALAALNGVAVGTGEVMTVGESGVMLRSDGNTWTPLSSGRIDQIRAVHGAADGQHGWAVGLNGTLLQWNGTYWSAVGLTGVPPNFYGVYTVSATDAWAVGTGGAVWRWNGSVWNQQSSGTTANLRAVWAAAANKVYVVGEGGVALLWDGSTWSQVGAGTTANLSAVTGSGPGDVWAAGDSGIVLHSTGGSFTTVGSGIAATTAIGGIWAGAANNVWFAADTSMYLYNGTSFTKYAIISATGLRAVSGSGSEVWAVGNAGAVLHWNGASWVVVDPGTKQDFYSIFLGPQKQWLGGALGTLLSRPR